MMNLIEVVKGCAIGFVIIGIVMVIGSRNLEPVPTTWETAEEIEARTQITVELPPSQMAKISTQNAIREANKKEDKEATKSSNIVRETKADTEDGDSEILVMDAVYYDYMIVDISGIDRELTDDVQGLYNNNNRVAYEDGQQVIVTVVNGEITAIEGR